MRETEELGDLIQEIKKLGITVLLVEHDMNLIMDISDRILVLDFGKVLASGNPAEIKENSAGGGSLPWLGKRPGYWT